MLFHRAIVAVIGAMFILTGCGGQKESSSATKGVPPSKSVATKNPVNPATAATITGTIKFTGEKPKRKKISMSADVYCKTQHATKIAAEDVVVNPNGTLKNAYVYVKSGLGDLQFAPPSKPVVLNQAGCMYVPHVLAVQTGQEIIVRNSDGVLHNVHARPKKNKPFNFGQPIKGMESTKKLTKPEVMIPIKCDVHPWMNGYIGVQNHPYADVTGDDGSFSLNNLPPGTYEVEAWHEVYGTLKQTVTVAANESKGIRFTFKGS